MRARFIHEGEECRVFGVVFVRMEWVDVSHLPEDHRRKLAANPTFHVDEDAGETPALRATPPPPDEHGAPPSRRQTASKPPRKRAR